MKKRTIILTGLTVTLAALAVSGLALPYRVEHSETATADADTAWAVISDLENYPTWNPHVARMEGEAVVGTQLLNQTRTGDTELTFTPEVLIADGRELRWRGSLWIRGLADGEHYYRIDPGPAPGQITVTQGEVFRGALVTLLRPWFTLEEEFPVSTRALVRHIEEQ